VFIKNSRYYNQKTVTVKDGQGHSVRAIELRRLADITGEKTRVTDSDQLDALSKQKYNDPTKFWRIADANTELEANALVTRTNRIINIPKS
jgi:hypothetical protein